jgi:hypothetical protein
MNYWVCKGRPWNEFRASLKIGATHTWYTKRRPKDLAKGDIAFLWESSPVRRLLGISEITQPDCGVNSEGKQLFRQRYLTRRLASAPGITELRQIPIVNKAVFLKSGPATTLTRLTWEQAEMLIRILRSRNPNGIPRTLSPDKDADIDMAVSFPDVALVATEGGRKLYVHYVKERRPGLARAKREAVLAATGRLACEVCGFDFARRYGSLGEGFCEVHHTVPLATLDEEGEVSLRDLVVLCSNCHRMIHKDGLKTVKQLRGSLRPGTR